MEESATNLSRKSNTNKSLQFSYTEDKPMTKFESYLLNENTDNS